MKQRRLINRIIAVILTVAVFVTAIPVTTTYAATEDVKRNVLDSVESELRHLVEEFKEVESDKASPISAGKWNEALGDGLAWNYFHNEVQKEIARNYGLEIEKKMYYKDENGELTGKYGKADLYIQDGDVSYIWEVKPYSYLNDPKKKRGEDQLIRYVETGKNYRIGDSRISNGEIKRLREVVRTGYTELVEYTITYESKSN